MSQRNKVVAMINKAQGILSQAAQENIPLWAQIDIQNEVQDLNLIIAKLNNLPKVD